MAAASDDRKIASLDWEEDLEKLPNVAFGGDYASLGRAMVEAIALGRLGVDDYSIVNRLYEEVDMADFVLYLLGALDAHMEARGVTLEAQARRIHERET